VTHDEIWKQFEELQQDYALADTQEERQHLAEEMNDNLEREQ